MASGNDRAAQAKASAAANEKAGQSFTAASTPSDNTGRGFSGGRVSFDKSGNKLVDNKIQQFASTSSYNQYLGERGVSNRGTIVNEGLFAKSDFSSVGGQNNAAQVFSESQKADSKPSSYQENYGYTPDVKASPIVSENFAKNPLETDFQAPKPPRKSGSAESVFQSGGVETPQSKALGSQYGWQALSAKTGTSFFTRGSQAEEQAKSRESTRAESLFTSNANPLPKSDNTFGGPVTPQSKGRSVDTGNRLVRDSPFEQNVKAKEDQRATQKYDASKEEKTAFFGPTKAISQAKQATVFVNQKSETKPFSENLKNDYGFIGPKNTASFTSWNVNIQEGLGIGEGLSGSSQLGKTNTPNKTSLTPEQLFASAEKQGVKEVSVFDEQGNALGSVKANQQGLDFVKSSFKDQGYSLSFGSGSSFIPSDVSNVLSKGGAVIVYQPDKTFPVHSTPIGLAFGPSGQKEYAKLMSQAGPKGSYGFEYPSTQKEILKNVQANPSYYEKQPNSYWEDLGMKGYLNEQGIDKVNNIFHMYDKQQNAPIREQNKATANFISRINSQNDPAYNFNIRNEKGDVVKTTTGQRSYYDFLKSEGYGSKSKDLGPYVNNTIEPHFSNTPEATSKRYDLIPVSPQQGIEAYGSDAKYKPQLGGLQAISRTAESMGGSFVAGLESAFVHGKNQIPSDWWKSGSLNKPIQTTAKDVFHTIVPISATSFLTKGEIKARNVELTPEASTIENRTSAPNILGVLMGKERASPNVSKEYYDVQSGFLVVGAIEGARQLNPFHYDRNPLLFQKEGTTPPKPAYSGITFGYGNYKTELIGKNPEGKIIFGRPSIEQQAPKGYRVFTPEQEGTEVANKGNAYSISKATNPKLFNYLAETGRTVQPNAGDIMSAIIEKNKVSVASGHTEAERPFQAGVTTDETVNKALIGGVVERQGFWSIFKRGGGRIGEVYGSGLTRAAGSKGTLGVMEHFFPQKDVEASIHPFLGLNAEAKGQALTSSLHNEILQAQGFVQNPITKSYETPRGPENLPPEKQADYAKQQIGEMRYAITSSASKRGLYTGGSTFLQLTVGKKGFRPVADVDLYFPVSKFSFIDNIRIGREAKIQTGIIKEHYKKAGRNPEDVSLNIFAKDPLGTGRNFIKIIDKNTGKSIVEIIPRTKPTKGIIKPDKVVTFAGIRGRKANQILRDKAIIIKSLEKKKASGKRLNANQQAKLDKAKKDIESFRNAEKISTSEMIKSGLLQDYLRTRVEGTKIYSYGKSISGKDVSEGGKVFEIPQLDPGSIASAPSKGSDIFGYRIDKSIKSYPSIVGKPIKGASQVFNKQTQEKKQATLQAKEALAQQGGVTQEHYNLIGEKFLVGEAVYSGGKALVRGSGLELDDALRLFQNPATKEQGIQHMKNIDIVGKGQSWFYGIDWNEFKTVYFEKRGTKIPEEIKNEPTYYNYVNQITGGKPISSFKPTKTSPTSDFGPSSYPNSRQNFSIIGSTSKSSLINSLTTKSSNNKPSNSFTSNKSSLSNLSNISKSSNNSQKSSKSIFSGSSGFSGKSDPSGKSSSSILSSLSSISGSSGFSGKSPYSGISSPNSLSGSSISGSSGFSALSGLSGLSSKSGSSSYSGYSVFSTKITKFPIPTFGNIGRKRKNKSSEGPTALYKLGTNNIFAPSLSIVIPKGKRFEF